LFFFVFFEFLLVYFLEFIDIKSNSVKKIKTSNRSNKGRIKRLLVFVYSVEEEKYMCFAALRVNSINQANNGRFKL